ncbi:MAG: cytochrome P450 [Gemmatimonas sp.]|jgi:cytochrome P450|uniref:cytochrome P450 n=1 Tax=Gemmatimonas sp. TaxID=1962908 RepID=UPI00391F6ABC|nr:cytochrome P450 [Gemmatimonadota bacterium]
MSASTSFPIGATVTIDQLADDPYPVFHHLRATEPVTWAPAIGQWLVTSRDLIMEVLRDTAHFRTDDPRSPIRETFGPQMLSTEGALQRRYKSACAPPFNAKAVDALTPLVHEVVAAHAGALPATGAELRSAYAAPVAVATVARVLGLDPAGDGLLREWYDTFADALINYAGDPGTRSRAEAAVRAFRVSLRPVLASPDRASQALLHTLARAYPRLLDDEEIAANALIVLFGGIETTEASIANTLWAMLSHPSALDVGQLDAEAMDRCVEETFRWEPAVQTCSRYAPEAVTLGGVPLPAGAIVQCMLGAANRDPARYRAPDRWNPTRADPTPHLAFGFGRHFCLGAALARLEARTALLALFRRHPRSRLDSERPSRPHGHEFRKPPRLDVLWE